MIHTLANAFQFVRTSGDFWASAVAYAQGKLRSTYAKAPREPSPYTRYTQMHALALQQPSPRARSAVLDYANRNVLPQLRIEEAALQILLAPITHLALQRGWCIDLAIDTNLSRQPVYTYAPRYRIDDIFSHKGGGFGLHLQPEATSGDYANILLFPGTYCTRLTQRDPLALKGGRPIGLRDDYRWHGIGRHSFANIKPWADACLQQAIGEQRKLVVAGHSLGAAVALRWMASLSADKQSHIDLLAYVAPGIDRATAYALKSATNRIRLLPHRWDVVRHSGVYRAPGREALGHDLIHEGVWRWKFPHSMPHLAIRELRGELPRVEPYRMQGPRFVLLAPIFEAFRRLIGLLFGPWLKH